MLHGYCMYNALKHQHIHLCFSQNVRRVASGFSLLTTVACHRPYPKLFDAAYLLPCHACYTLVPHLVKASNATWDFAAHTSALMLTPLTRLLPFSDALIQVSVVSVVIPPHCRPYMETVTHIILSLQASLITCCTCRVKLHHCIKHWSCTPS